jgi:hypothetical protein
MEFNLMNKIIVELLINQISLSKNGDEFNKNRQSIMLSQINAQ